MYVRSLQYEYGTEINALVTFSVDSFKFQQEVVKNKPIKKRLNSIIRKFLGRQ
jgi:hypothetical protein